MQHASGVITVVQEGRFQLATDDGRCLLFVLGSGSRVEPQDLPHFARAGRVTVDFTTPAKRRAFTAHSLHVKDLR